MLNLRVKVALGKEHRRLFLGLGRSGSELDFTSRQGRIMLFNLPIKSFSLEKTEKAEKPVKKKAVKKKTKVKRERSLKDVIGILPQSGKALVTYFIQLFKAAVVEEFYGRIEGGFASPDLTGRVYGYYQAIMGAIPALAGNFEYRPVWSEAAVSGAVRIQVALPLYKLILRTLGLIFRLPLRKLIKLAIGTKKGAEDVQ